MTEAFTASNGIELRVNGDGWVERRNSTELGTGRWDEISGLLAKGRAPIWDALRELFLHERDKELGRWRSKKNPSWMAVESSAVVRFWNEDGLRLFSVCSESRDCTWEAREFREVAKEYFDAHPALKPWHDAKPGEVWVVKFQIGSTVHEAACTVVEKGDALMFEDPVDETYIRVTGEILDAHKIWPWVVSDA